MGSRFVGGVRPCMTGATRVGGLIVGEGSE